MDQFLQHWINQEATAPWLDQLMAGITNFSAWKPFLLAAFLVGMIFGKFRLRAMLLCLIITLGFTDGILVNSIKHAVGRLRPFQAQEGVRVVHLKNASPQFLSMATPPKVKVSEPPHAGEVLQGRSFPSSHSANIMLSATVIFLFYRRWGMLAFLIASLVFYSRVYTGAHWPTDVLAGATIGCLSAITIVALLNKAWQRWGPKLFPVIEERHPGLLTGR
ncbi:MAG: phosphatase PAP2 family protein [Verrucomicrobiae bacterium]|nr:phosphatase PAP2 family protein [Verrucomicrobiae bacterium]